MTIVTEKHVVGGRRSVMQQARLAVRDIYDAIVELVTNADDRYQHLDCAGTIEIIVERSRLTSERHLEVRDFADGMTLEVMDKKLSQTGGRVSGLEEGMSVRGTNSRGAKDIAALGKVTFDSIAQEDGKLHSSEITDGFVFKPRGTREVTPELREAVRIPSGSGTVVRVRLGANHAIPQYENLRDHIQRLVALRDILKDPRRKILLRDSSKTRAVELHAPPTTGNDRVKETFAIPGYVGAQAKLIITRAAAPFEREPNRFRLGGILVKSKHAIHEATYFDADLESNPHALWFYGKLTCPTIDDLWNDFDDRFERDDAPEIVNPVPILDPSRQSGLTRSHPFVQALYREALKRLRPLVEEERQREENQRVTIESDATRKRLNALEKAAAKFMEDYGEDDEVARDPEGQHVGSHFKKRGFVLSPPFSQILKDHTQRFALTVNQEIFPELEAGANVQIECLTADITSDRLVAGLVPHPQQDGVLRAVWGVKGLQTTSATGIRVRVGSITAESVIEVFATEADKYKDILTLSFAKKRYHLTTDGTKKRLRVFAPLNLVPRETELEVSISSSHFRLSGTRILRPNDKLGVAISELTLLSDGSAASGTITVRALGQEATAELFSHPSPGAGIKIELKDIDLKHGRSRWRQNVLEIAARHQSVSRYLGSKASGFSGQESKHFRLLLAEIVADAVCYKVLAENIQKNPEDYENADWDQYYADYTKFSSEFLPLAHKLQCPEGV